MKRLAAAALALSLLVSAGAVWGQQARVSRRWIGTWTTAAIARRYPPAAASGAPPVQGNGAPIPLPNNQTLRQIVHVTAGGDRVRVTLTNAFGATPLAIGAAHVALRDKDAAIVVGSDRILTFSGKAAFDIPAGAVAVSDPVSLKVAPFVDVAIDLFLPGDSTAQTVTIHRSAHQTSYLSPSGNHAGATDLPAAATVTSWYFLGELEVAGTAGRIPVIVALGDSITDGTASTLDANHRWPDLLARRLGKAAVLNAGIGGNRLLSESIAEFGVNILARFDRDVLLQPGVTHVIVIEGINDIGNARDEPSPSAADIIAAQQQLIERAHGRGLKIIGATLTPFGGASYWTSTGEAKRQALNDWIRTGRAYDGVIDFEAAVRDPQQPLRMQASLDSGDHLHPSDAGYQAMGNAIDLALFK
jgi:lysophospholipase L1-like esterase